MTAQDQRFAVHVLEGNERSDRPFPLGDHEDVALEPRRVVSERQRRLPDRDRLDATGLPLAGARNVAAPSSGQGQELRRPGVSLLPVRHQRSIDREVMRCWRAGLYRRRCRRWRRMRLNTTSASTPWTEPSASSRARRSASAIHAASASGSSGPSRLRRRMYARLARCFGRSARAASRSLSMRMRTIVQAPEGPGRPDSGSQRRDLRSNLPPSPPAGTLPSLQRTGPEGTGYTPC